MKLFGKGLGDYLHFQRLFIALILVVGLMKLSLSLAGAPTSMLNWLSLTALTTIGFVYYSVRVSTSGFGSYWQLLPLLIIQNALAQAVIIGGIAIGIATGRDNVFTVPEHSGLYRSGRSWAHAGGHLIFGVVVLSLVWWAIGCVVILLMAKIGSSKTRATG
jgi:hypothetical protein